MDLMTPVMFVVGLALLIGGAESLVRGAARLATAIGISPLIVGLTVVSFSTSSPELAVGLQSALAGQADIALGNVIGSNIFNILLILGLSALIAPLFVDQQLIRLDVPLMIGVSALPLILGLDGVIGRGDGLLLFAGIVAYIVFVVWQSRRESTQVQTEYAQEYCQEAVQARSARQLALNIALIVVGLGMLVLGSRWMLEGAVALARAFGLSELIIGLTIVSIGTSLPEIAASVVASLRGERDIAVGNIIGSNLFNILAILGITAAAAPGGVAVPAEALSFDIPVMIAVAVICLPIFFTGFIIERWEGALFLSYYIAYTAFLILSATSHAALPTFVNVMLFVAIPLTVLTLIASSLRALYAGRRKAAAL